MAYKSMKKIIEVNREKFMVGLISEAEYEIFKYNTLNKLDVFLSCNRLTPSQYNELVNLLNTMADENYEVLE